MGKKKIIKIVSFQTSIMQLKISHDGNNRVEKWPDGLVRSPYLKSFSLFTRSLQPSLLLLVLFLSTTRTQTHKHAQGGQSRPPVRSSSTQLGSRMIKAVAGGLHFETINRPSRAASNSQPSISVSASSRGVEGEDMLRVRGQTPPLDLHCAPYHAAEKYMEQLWRNS